MELLLVTGPKAIFTVSYMVAELYGVLQAVLCTNHFPQAGFGVFPRARVFQNHPQGTSHLMSRIGG